ncbi:MAG: MarR family winged helix-turn-helix transcriptional regulator [Acidimicrobiales bacterium]
MVRKAKEQASEDGAEGPVLVTRTRLAILRLARRLRQQTLPGITPSQQSALAAIDHRGPLTLGELAAFENVRPPSITRIVAALEAEQWVERTTDPDDRRVTTVQATARGRRELRRIREERNAWLATRLALLDDDELARLVAALPVIERLTDSVPDPDPGDEPAGSGR